MQRNSENVAEKFKLLLDGIEKGDPFDFIDNLNGFSNINYQNSVSLYFLVEFFSF